jgi:hypothetical protein
MNEIAYYLSGINLKMVEVFMEVMVGKEAMVVIVVEALVAGISYVATERPSKYVCRTSDCIEDIGS